MKQYRIKKNFNGHYNIEQKELWYWIPLRDKRDKYEPFGSDWPGYTYTGCTYTNYTYTEAKTYIENLVAAEQIEKARRQFVPKYYYPPLPDKDPTAADAATA
jgi:hypothetical protein